MSCQNNSIGFSKHQHKVKYLNLPVGWWIGPPKRRACGVRQAASGGSALLLLLGLLANLTVMGSVEPLGMVPLSSWMARSASILWSNLMKPTPLDRPASAQEIGFSGRSFSLTPQEKVGGVRASTIRDECNYTVCQLASGQVHENSRKPTQI